MLKFCPRCQKSHPKEYFNWKILNKRRQVHCKDCSRKYIREHYYKNRTYYLKKINKRNTILKKKQHDYVGFYLSTHPCVDCGETNIIVLEFDHKNKFNKRVEVSRIFQRRMSMDSLIKEIRKCDVRCANCHRKKTATESRSWKISYQKLYNMSVSAHSSTG